MRKNKVCDIITVLADMADRGSPKMRRHFWGGSGRRDGLKSSKNKVFSLTFRQKKSKNTCADMAEWQTRWI